ncbi:cag pathogenicity island protein R [Helicobacter pylori Shi169]|uniref:Cag pathogenicity island protein R n=1 Tax=Helicobacter pylori Shi169 TaxID=1163741 RepID=A0A0E0WAD4_HELPX|nr:cag pathogenicity island protein R [Helicobacter pylori Shi169]
MFFILPNPFFSTSVIKFLILSMGKLNFFSNISLSPIINIRKNKKFNIIENKSLDKPIKRFVPPPNKEAKIFPIISPFIFGFLLFLVVQVLACSEF